MPGAHIVGDASYIHVGEGAFVQPGCVLDDRDRQLRGRLADDREQRARLLQRPHHRRNIHRPLPCLLGPRGRPGAVDWAGPDNPADAPHIDAPRWELSGTDAYVWGQHRPSVLTVETRDGEIISHRSDAPPGAPGAAPDDSEVTTGGSGRTVAGITRSDGESAVRWTPSPRLPTSCAWARWTSLTSTSHSCSATGWG